MIYRGRYVFKIDTRPLQTVDNIQLGNVELEFWNNSSNNFAVDYFNFFWIDSIDQFKWMAMLPYLIIFSIEIILDIVFR